MGSFFPTRLGGHSHNARVELLKLFEKALIARDYDALGLMVSEDLCMLDTASSPIDGRGNFVEALRTMFRENPDLIPVFQNFVSQDGGLLVSGYLRTPDTGGEIASLWRVQFEGPLISAIQSFRTENALSLVKAARGAGIQQA